MAEKKYKKNENYNQEDFRRFVEIYKFAGEIGNTNLRKTAAASILGYVEKYIFKELWTKYPTLMRNPHVRDDLKQDLMCMVLEEIDKWNPEQGSITTFLRERIKHSVAKFCSTNFRNTSLYYAKNMERITAAQNFCRQNQIQPTFETLCKITGLPASTTAECLGLLQRKDSVSYEALTEIGFEGYSKMKSPERVLMEKELQKSFEDFIHNNLTDTELEVIRLLVNPDAPAKIRASYKEISEKMEGMNVPKAKEIVNRVVAKIKNDEKLSQYLDILLVPDTECSDIENFNPTMDDKDWIGEQMREFSKH